MYSSKTKADITRSRRAEGRIERNELSDRVGMPGEDDDQLKLWNLAGCMV